MINMKTIIKSALLRSIMTWAIPAWIWLGASLYMAFKDEILMSECILWSPCIIIIFLTTMDIKNIK